MSKKHSVCLKITQMFCINSLFFFNKISSMSAHRTVDTLLSINFQSLLTFSLEKMLHGFILGDPVRSLVEV